MNIDKKTAAALALAAAAIGGAVWGISKVGTDGADDDDLSSTPDPDRDRPCVACLADVIDASDPWSRSGHPLSPFTYDAKADLIGYGGNTFTTTTILPDGQGDCGFSWTDGGPRRLVVEWQAGVYLCKAEANGLSLDTGAGYEDWSPQ